MGATPVVKLRQDFDDQAILEMTVWRVPVPVIGCNHLYRYRLFYGYPGARVIGYDNEPPKGDHKHIEDRQEPYVFTDVERLVADFLADVERRRLR
jgi:hypothetical protein